MVLREGNLDADRVKGIKFNAEKKGRKVPKGRFEDTLDKLEKIVSKLEEGDISLEESLKLFEEGIRLSRFCNQKLDEAEKKVEVLLKGKDGVLKPQPFDPSIEGGQSLSINSEKDLFEEDDEKGTAG